MFEVFGKVEIEIGREIISTPGMIKETKEILQYEEEDFRLKEMIMQNEAKVKVCSAEPSTNRTSTQLCGKNPCIQSSKTKKNSDEMNRRGFSPKR